MSKVLILCAHRPKRSPSQRYRFEQYLPYLELKGFSFQFSYLLNEEDDKLFYSKGNFFAKVFILFKSILIRIKDCFRFSQFDIIFIQREASFFGTSFFEKRAFRSGAKVIFDFDDSIWLADTSPGNKKWEWIKKPEKFFKNLRYAHVVIAGNKYLAEKAKPINPNTVIIPTSIDTSFHVSKPELRNKAKLIVGWSGSISTLKHFELLIPVLKRLKEKYSDAIGFKIVGDPNYRNNILKLDASAWTEETEVDQLNSFDIGLMPLPDDAWANGKCGLKALSYMACEVPCVLSAVGVNKEIIQQGKNGFLAGTDEDWFTHLCQLIDDKDLRLAIGKAGRKSVEENYSVRVLRDRYLKVFKDVESA